MADLKKHAILLSLLTILLVAKFVIVPIFTWQEQVLAEINAQEKKLGKTSILLAKEDDFNSLNQKVSDQLKEAEQLFYPYQKSSLFKLEQQKYFEDLIAKHQLTLSNFSWQAESDDKNLQITRYQVRARIKGKVSYLVKLIAALESQQNRIEIVGFNIPMKGQNDNSLGNTKNAHFTIRFYVANQAGPKGRIHD